MSYKANLIRATNAPGPSNYNRRNRRRRRQPIREQSLPTLPQGHAYYAIAEDVQVQISVRDGAIIGHEQRLSPETISTLNEIKRRAKRGKHFGRMTSIFCDKCSPGFEWLLDGWIAEKRILPDVNTHYWVYYDPLGRQYRSKQQVSRFCTEQDFLYSSASQKATKAR
ncbi:uncharacterized protein LOC123193325 [Mangifera indica]|uniref:uncharacterized protein LOC123193325 n=1 Tax=Mangifera indica TaxID=29780 RepID=UPI001CFA8CB4|nr:uncharacterized protein LOC123193325 [Mangifera indica]